MRPENATNRSRRSSSSAILVAGGTKYRLHGITHVDLIGVGAKVKQIWTLGEPIFSPRLPSPGTAVRKRNGRRSTWPLLTATELNDRPRRRLAFRNPIEEVKPLLLR
jgi:hypothetical protein